jgi:hypothetical protein
LDQYGSDDDEDEAAGSGRQLQIDFDSSTGERSQVIIEMRKEIETHLVRLTFFFLSAGKFNRKKEHRVLTRRPIRILAWTKLATLYY